MKTKSALSKNTLLALVTLPKGMLRLCLLAAAFTCLGANSALAAFSVTAVSNVGAQSGLLNTEQQAAQPSR